MSENAKVPASVRAAWGVPDRPQRGPKPALSLDRIVTAAVDLADREGLAAVSMSRVATEVDATAMALYRYVGNKEELLALMVDASLGPPPETAAEQGWREGLSAWAWAENEAYAKHDWGLRIPLNGMPMLPNQMSWLEHGLRCLAGTGLSEEEKLSTILLLSNMVRGYATMEADLQASVTAAGGDPEAMLRVFRSFMDGVVDTGRFPAVHAAMASGVLDQADPPGKELQYGLERLLDGVAALIEQAHGEQGQG
jgi:AcrR family transcriptional regulator